MPHSCKLHPQGDGDGKGCDSGAGACAKVRGGREGHRRQALTGEGGAGVGSGFSFGVLGLSRVDIAKHFCSVTPPFFWYFD